MRITVNDLISVPALRKCNLIAGENGLSNRVTWPYVILSSTVVGWVSGYEIAIYAKDDAPTVEAQIDIYRNLINEALETNLSALIISVNPDFITEFPEDVINLANDYAIPIFIAPWDISSNTFSKSLISYIVKHQNKYPLSDEFIRSMIFGTNQDENFILRFTTDAPSKSNSFFMISINYKYIEKSGAEGYDEIELNYIEQQISHYISLPFTILNACEINNSFLYTLSAENYEKALITPLLKKLGTAIHNRYPLVKFSMGVSSKHTSMSEIKTAFKESRTAALYTNYMIDSNDTFHYADDFMAPQLLMASSDSSLEQYYRSVLKEIIRNDKSYSTNELINTLKCYIQNGCNISKTSTSMYIHINTLRNRLSKIETLSGKSLSNAHELYDIMTALLAYDIVHRNTTI